MQLASGSLLPPSNVSGGTGIEKDALGHFREVTDILTSRAAILYSVLEQVPLEQACDEVSEIYDCRSDLVHGSVSPLDDSVVGKVNRTYEITRSVMFATLDYYATLGLENPAMNKNGLKAAFKKLERWNATGRPSSF